MIDDTGRVVWYVRFPEGPSLNFQAQSNGRYIARPFTPDTSHLKPLLKFDPLGTVTRRLGCARYLRPRFHDLLVQPDGSYWLMCDETRVMDLSGVGGVARRRSREPSCSTSTRQVAWSSSGAHSTTSRSLMWTKRPDPARR